ncbi:cellulose-binding domain-containing protein [Streptomyces sp. NBC_00656]|uniref:cellulose binding domain-containing protein n=1 Tax=Streptomyces sp. NBC_00656 TaxID=2903668 RepID=UPI0032466120
MSPRALLNWPASAATPLAWQQGAAAHRPPHRPTPTATTEPTPTAEPTPTPTATSPAGAPCKVTYQLSDWGTTFNADVTIRNTGTTAVDGWELSFNFPSDQSITQIWNASRAQDGRKVSATHPTGYNTSISPGSTVNFGFSGTSRTGTNGLPTAFTLNGKACTAS